MSKRSGNGSKPISTPRETERSETIALHRDRLRQLVALEASVTELKAKECDLEVDRIAVRAALTACSSRAGAAVDLEDAHRIMQAQERVRSFESPRSNASSRHSPAENLHLAAEALRAWMSSGKPESPQRPMMLLNLFLLAISIGSVVLAFSIHFAFLALLVPVGATSALMWTGDDASWRRIGARRRFEASGIKPPTAWEGARVAQRLAEIEADMSTTPAATDQVSEADTDAVQSAEHLEEARRDLQESLARLGVERLDPELRADLERKSQCYRAEQALAEVKSKLRSVGEEAESLRSQVRAFLVREGVAPADGKADVATLSRAFERL